MKAKRRETEAFSISFLDVITCGFGAIILLLMIARPGQEPVLETTLESMHEMVRELQVRLFSARDETEALERELATKKTQHAQREQRATRLQEELRQEEARRDELRANAAVDVVIRDELEDALQTLTQEVRQLRAREERSPTDVIGGIPVDSEYVIFIIDTSNSMVSYHWRTMISQLVTTLDVYPRVKGLQILSDMGEYLFSGYRRAWIPDTQGRRNAIISALRNWRAFSNSSPVEGVTRAIRDFYDPEKKIGIYVYGDEFTGPSIRDVVDQVERINPRDRDGNTQVRIHAVGFPAPANAPPYFQETSRRYALLMRELTRSNNGAFVGLSR